MSAQRSLFDEPAPRLLARRTDPATSHAAAVDLYGTRATHRLAILEAIAAAGARGLTYPEVGDRTGIDGIEPARRISDLLHAELIEALTDDDGRDVTRALPSGRQGRVYVLARRRAS